ncbi:hypothetical protein [Aminobacter sp. MET-1]|uniref:hypothetical protein n=1 Tax=Aminobacter sp. MET-1 TaxID=2951085 RepID=UPI002269C145|nr:hypothetical protein [Aminobacter sp. MET-1]MCX8571071.1 hypothetical protein [Aminobacter sp. MET-1]MCX8573260.1 hypothetical protein [Aminobacter sp. MET-1]
MTTHRNHVRTESIADDEAIAAIALSRQSGKRGRYTALQNNTCRIELVDEQDNVRLTMFLHQAQGIWTAHCHGLSFRNAELIVTVRKAIAHHNSRASWNRIQTE